MTRTLRPFLQRFIALAGRDRVRGIVADQEMRSVALFLALDMIDDLKFVTTGPSPVLAQEAAFEIEGLFVLYRSQARKQEALRKKPQTLG